MNRIIWRSVLCLIICVSLTSFISCKHHNSLPHQPPERVLIKGQIVELDGQAKYGIDGVKVSYVDFIRVSRDNGVFQLNLIPQTENTIKLEKSGYETVFVPLPAEWRNAPNLNLGQVVIERSSINWDIEANPPMGWYDLSMPYFYWAKLIGILDDIQIHGANAIVTNVYRSWGLEYHDGGCPDGIRGDGWWEHIVEGGWDDKQFGHEPFVAPFMNIHESQEVSEQWLTKMENITKEAEKRGLWNLVSLTCPYDFKWYGHPWWYWGDCDVSPFVDGDRFHTEWQEIYIKALLNRIKNYPNVIITDNWEEGGYDDSVNLRWKKKVFNWVQEVIPNVPYFVYIGDDFVSDRSAAIQWINTEPRITGLQSHYNLNKNHSFYGLSQDKWLMATEQHGLSLADVYNALEWMQGNEKRCFIMYVGEYRNFMNPEGTGLPDDKVEERIFWYAKIEEVLNNWR